MNNPNKIFDELNSSMDQLHKLLEEADKHVNQLYKQMENFVSQEEEETKKKQKDLINQYKGKHVFFNGKIQNIKKQCSSEKFQIFFYGKVSTGKSKIINAILRNDIFQSGSSHTTSCFVRICKSSDQYHHIEYRNERNRFNRLDDLKTNIRNLTTTASNSQNQLHTNELLSVYLNISNNAILTSKSEIIDCPGSANTSQITNYIKDKALNANIFIFVLTGGMTEDERSFFQNQWEQSSQPIIFFLVNKWDQAYNDGDDVAEDSKRKITRGIINFLINNIGLSENESKKRLFFVSALYICEKRNIGNGTSIRNNKFEPLCDEFERFEATLSEFIDSFIGTIYVEELKVIKSQIENTKNEFKNEFQNKINIRYIEKLKRFLRLIKECSKRNVINNKINDIKSKLREFERKCKNINRYEIESLNMEFNNLRKENKVSILTLHIEIGELIDKQIQNYKETCNINVIKEKHELKEKMEEEIKLKTITETGWNKFCNFITKLFTFLRSCFLENLKKHDVAILEENCKNIKSGIDDLVKNLINPLSDYLKTETDKITNQLETKITAYAEFSEKIN